MHCSKAINQLQFYIDGQLSVEQMRSLEEHLSHCPACRDELFLLEEVARSLQGLKVVTEPEDLTARIMQCVALTPQKRREPIFALLRPSLGELIAVIVLATIASLGVLLGQPSVRELLPIANGHDPLSLIFINILHQLTTMDAGTLTLAFWIIGTFLGICITLIFAGNEMRTRWLKAVMERIPVR